MKVIGFAGLAEAGKTTAANQLASLILDGGIGVPRIRSFAGPLKRSAELLGAAKDVNPRVYREYCQMVGKYLREIDDDHWVNMMTALMESIEQEKEDSETILIIDDVRYQNEVDLIRSKGGVVVYCDATKRGIIGAGTLYEHESERFAVDYIQGKSPDESVDFVIPTYEKKNTESILHSLFFRTEQDYLIES